MSVRWGRVRSFVRGCRAYVSACYGLLLHGSGAHYTNPQNIVLPLPELQEIHWDSVYLKRHFSRWGEWGYSALHVMYLTHLLFSTRSP